MTGRSILNPSFDTGFLFGLRVGLWRCGGGTGGTAAAVLLLITKERLGTSKEGSFLEESRL